MSNLGTWLQNTAQALLAYHLTHSALAVGLVVCFQFTPVLLARPGRRNGGRPCARPAEDAHHRPVRVRWRWPGTLAFLEFTGRLTVIGLPPGR